MTMELQITTNDYMGSFRVSNLETEELFDEPSNQFRGHFTMFTRFASDLLEIPTSNVNLLFSTRNLFVYRQYYNCSMDVFDIVDMISSYEAYVRFWSVRFGRKILDPCIIEKINWKKEGF